MPRFTAICDWQDDSVADSDEIQVLAKTAAGATSRARAVWSSTKGAEHPTCRLEKVWILTKERMGAYL
jgi:hypothetical protein